MYLIVDYQVGLDIGDCIAFYTAFEQNLIALLRRDYDGVCRDGNLILRVLRVMRTSECMFVCATTPTVGSLNVIFRALVVNYSPNDLIAGCVAQIIKPRNLIVVGSQFATVLITQSEGDGVSPILSANSVVSVVTTGTAASPGDSHISVFANIHEPSAQTYFYPITPGTHAQIVTCKAMSREKYAPIMSILELIGYSPSSPDAPSDDASDVPSDAPASADTPQPLARAGAADMINGTTVLLAAREIAEYMNGVIKRCSAVHERMPSVIRKLFYAFKEERVPDGLRPDGKTPAVLAGLIDLLDPRIPDNATCIVTCGELHPLDGKVGYTTRDIASLPETWVRGELEQPAGVVLARRLERFIDSMLVAATTAMEFMDPVKLRASQSFITLQAKRKKA
jgi:hypothetical protein